MSFPEVILWKALQLRPSGLKFRRQFPIEQMTADFTCLSHRLVIEVDGDWHGLGNQPQRDIVRDAIMNREGFEVMRIAARDVLNDLDSVIRAIVARCEEVGPLHHPSAGPPPRSGDDFS